MKVRLELDVHPSEAARVAALVSALRDFAAALSAYSPSVPSPPSARTSTSGLSASADQSPLKATSPAGAATAVFPSPLAAPAAQLPVSSAEAECFPHLLSSFPPPATAPFAVEVTLDAPESHRALKPFDGRPPSPDPVPALDLPPGSALLHPEIHLRNAPASKITHAVTTPILHAHHIPENRPTSALHSHSHRPPSHLSVTEPALFAVARKSSPSEPSLFSAVPYNPVKSTPSSSTEHTASTEEPLSVDQEHTGSATKNNFPKKQQSTAPTSKQQTRDSRQRNGRTLARKKNSSTPGNSSRTNNTNNFAGKNIPSQSQTPEKNRNDEARRGRNGRGGRFNGALHHSGSTNGPDEIAESEQSNHSARSNVDARITSSRTNHRRRPLLSAIPTPQGIFAAVAVSSITVKRAISDLEGMLSRKANPVTQKDIIRAATAEIVDPAKVCNHPSRGLNVVKVLVGLGETFLREFKQEFVTLAVKQFLKERAIECDRAQFLGYADGVAALVEEQCISADAALKTIWRLLLAKGCWTAAVTTLCKLTETCNGMLEVRCLDQELVEKVKEKLVELAERKEFLYDITYLNGALSWTIPVPQ